MQQDDVTEPAREELDRMPGAVVVEFGTSWCGHCQAAQPLLSPWFAQRPHVRRIRVEDGKGRKLGRTYKVKLWPTLVFLANGVEVARLVRPTSEPEIQQAFEQMEARCSL
jgi:thioredoxin 1